jgi:hypothetical protein
MTSTTGSRTGPSRTGWAVAGVLGGLILLTLLVAGAWFIGGGQPRTVADLVTSQEDIDPVEATSELCEESGCVEAWETTHGAYLGFSSSGAAEYWAMILGDDGRRWKNIVLDLRGTELTFDERRRAIDVLFSAHDWQ